MSKIFILKKNFKQLLSFLISNKNLKVLVKIIKILSTYSYGKYNKL